jgi:hypothetical protein
MTKDDTAADARWFAAVEAVQSLAAVLDDTGRAPRFGAAGTPGRRQPRDAVRDRNRSIAAADQTERTEQDPG